MTLSNRALLGLVLAVLVLRLVATGAAAGEVPKGWVRLSDLAPGIAQDIRYARDFNFTGAPVPGYEAAECLLLAPVAEALQRVEARLADQGYGLVIFDCYRPQRAVDAFAAWAAGKDGPDMGPIFFPALTRAQLIPQGYIARHSSHSRGTTLDLGLRLVGAPVPRPETAGACDAAWGIRADDTGLDLGTAFDCFSPLSATDAAVGAEALANRRRLARAMQEEGFRPYKAEWWHFTYELSPRPPEQDFPIR